MVILVPALMATALLAAPGCNVTDATLNWGFKESFRAYIDSSIANGEWTTSNGASYSTPTFRWSGGTGRYDPATGEGTIAFTGTVRFTGHDGLLDTTIENPTIQMRGKTATLLLDVTGATMTGDMVDTDDVPFVSLSPVAVVGSDAVRTLDAETALTADGARAFPNYSAGDAFDPVAVSLTVGKACPAAAEPGSQAASFPIVGLLTAAGALAALAGATVFLLFRRRRRA